MQGASIIYDIHTFLDLFPPPLSLSLQNLHTICLQIFEPAPPYMRTSYMESVKALLHIPDCGTEKRKICRGRRREEEPDARLRHSAGDDDLRATPRQHAARRRGGQRRSGHKAAQGGNSIGFLDRLTDRLKAF